MTVWKELDFWKYEMFDCNIEPEMLPGFEDLFRLWQSKRGDRLIPAWSDFDFYDFKGWHGRIAMMEIYFDPFDYLYRLFGEEIRQQYNVDFTGKTGSELVRKGFEREEELEFYEMVCRKTLISRVSGELKQFHRPYASATFVEFPLSDNGETTTHTVMAMTLK